ncbi:MAG TPA: hypothetical protein EYH32_04910 [Anaerolineae bacterium]|nr:hypothetical protein [Anaerolineae bacterium]
MGEKRYCRCGHTIWVGWRWNGLDSVPAFIDSVEDSPTVGLKIYNCPRCGECLDDVKRLMTEWEYHEYCETLAEQEALAAAAEGEAAAGAEAQWMAEHHGMDAVEIDGPEW